jgi:hypothetical protein
MEEKMITKSRYDMLVSSCKMGANLAPVDFKDIKDFEKKNKVKKPLFDKKN